MGYHRAGFSEIVGVDLKPQPRYPFKFIQGDAIDYLIHHGDDFDAFHASPPCQRYSVATNSQGNRRQDHPDLLPTTRELLSTLDRPWIIENVEGAPMRPPAVMLCGLMFSLGVFRHRWFETSFLPFGLDHPSHEGHRIGEGGMCCVAGHGGQSSGFGNRKRRVPADHRTKAAWSRAMRIDWMQRDELAQAIPPAYTEYMGRQLARQVEQPAKLSHGFTSFAFALVK
jgi:DNA (cytosine-5)-methyltransferase 1